VGFAQLECVGFQRVTAILTDIPRMVIRRCQHSISKSRTRSVTNNLVTSFPSWMGVADPEVSLVRPSPGIGQPADVWHGHQGRNDLISIAQLSFTMTSTDPGNNAGLDLLAHSLLILGFEHRQHRIPFIWESFTVERPEYLCHQWPADPIGQ